MTPQSPAPVAPAAGANSLDAAWQEAEAALPGTWRLESVRRRYAGSTWIASAVEGGIGQQERSKGTVPNRTGTGTSPAQALRALAQALRDAAREPLA